VTTAIGATAPPPTTTGAAAVPAGQRAQLKAAAQSFEAVFARQLIGSMRTSGLGDDLFGSEAADQFRDMSDSRLADSMASSGALGIAALLERQLSALVPASQGGAAK